MNQRQELRAEILEDVDRVINEELADAPDSLTKDARKAIRDQMTGKRSGFLRPSATKRCDRSVPRSRTWRTYELT